MLNKVLNLFNRIKHQGVEFKRGNDYFEKYLRFLGEKNLYPDIHIVNGASSSPEIVVNGKKFLTFSSNNYLGLAGDPRVKKAVTEGIEKYGIGSGSTRLLSGTLDVQVEFERKLAEFLNLGESITFSSGFLANVGVIRMLIDPFPYFTLFGEKPGVIFSDQLNHASIIDGVRLSKAEKVVYRHNDMEDLEKGLREKRRERKLILTDGVFSMDGDLARLKEIVELAKIYNCLIMIDDAHGTGVLGEKGAGTANHLGVTRGVDVVMGSFTKAFGNIGGFVATSSPIGDYLRITARSYIFSDPIIPGVVNGLIKVLELIQEGDGLRQKVLSNARHLRDNLKKLGFKVLGEETSIVPLFIGSEEKAIKFYSALMRNHILAPCIRRPAVPLGAERIRFSLMATHKKGQIDTLLNVCERIGKSLEII